MKCQSRFPGANKTKYLKMSSAEIFTQHAKRLGPFFLILLLVLCLRQLNSPKMANMPTGRKNIFSPRKWAFMHMQTAKFGSRSDRLFVQDCLFVSTVLQC